MFEFKFLFVNYFLIFYYHYSFSVKFSNYIVWDILNYNITTFLWYFSNLPDKIPESDVTGYGCTFLKIERFPRFFQILLVSPRLIRKYSSLKLVLILIYLVSLLGLRIFCRMHDKGLAVPCSGFIECWVVDKSHFYV